MGSDKSLVLRRQERGSAGIVKDAEQHLVVHDLCTEITDQADTPVPDSLQEGSDFLSVRQDIAGHSTAVDRVDRMTVPRQQPAVFIAHIPYFRHEGLASGALKGLAEGCELGRRGAFFQEIHNGNGGKGGLVRLLALRIPPLCIDAQKSFRP